jgi:microcystin-dependent protein
MTIATGERMYADDILNLLFFPKGAILMYDGTSWQDNVTLKGWYQCAGQETPYGNTPDLRNKFIMGYESGSRAGGNNSLSLSTANLPAHNHSLNITSLSGLTLDNAGAHTHAVNGSAAEGGSHSHTYSSTTDSKGGHTHSYDTKNSEPVYGTKDNAGACWVGTKSANTSSAGAHTHTVSGTTSTASTHTHNLSGTASEAGSHTHTINSSNATISGSVGSAGSGTAFDNRPSYYALVYIIKMTTAGN